MIKKPYAFPELRLALESMRTQSELYCPTVFWQEGSSIIVDDLEAQGLDCFRSLQSTLNYFAPTYGAPGSGFSAETVAEFIKQITAKCSGGKKQKLAIEQFFNGYMSALSDYRVLLAADRTDRLPFLHKFSESAVGMPVEHFEFEGRYFSRSSLNYLLGLCFLKQHLSGEFPKTILEIGGGFGSLGEVLASSGIPGLKYIDVDIPPTSFVAQYYLSEVLGSENVATFAKTKNLESIDIDNLPKASVLCSWQIEKLRGKVDLFVNFISFQEMEPHIVRNYLDHVIRLGTRWVLLRNLREGKQKRQENCVGVETPTRGDDYVDMLTGYDLVARCVWPFGYRTVDGFNSELLLLRRKD